MLLEALAIGSLSCAALPLGMTCVNLTLFKAPKGGAKFLSDNQTKNKNGKEPYKLVFSCAAASAASLAIKE